MSYFGIVLAAGTSSRMQSTKALLRLDGVPLVEHAARLFERAGATPLVVVGARKEYIVQVIPGRRWVSNQNYAQGMGTSVACAVSEVADQAEVICILPVDQPGIDSQHLSCLFESARAHGLAATRHDDRNLGAPAAFGRRYFDELMDLRGREGARSILARERPPALEAEFPQDVDTPDQWRRFVRLYRRAPHRMPQYEVSDGLISVEGTTIEISPGGVLVVRDQDGRTDLETYRELGAEDTDPIIAPEFGLIEIAQAADEVRKRFETHMLDGRTFSASEFEQYFIENRFVRAFSRGVVWQVAGERGWRDARVAEDDQLVDEFDDALHCGHMRIPHPLEIRNVEAWTEIFADHEVIHAFEQLDRPIYDAFEPRELHRVDPLSFHRIALNLGFEPSEVSMNSYSVSLTRTIRDELIVLSASPGYPFEFPDDDAQSIDLHFESDSEIVISETCRLWRELRQHLEASGGYITY